MWRLTHKSPPGARSDRTGGFFVDITLLLVILALFAGLVEFGAEWLGGDARLKRLFMSLTVMSGKGRQPTHASELTDGIEGRFI